MTQSHLSRETHERLSNELDELTTVGRIKIAQAIEAARDLGDLSENGDYHAAKDEQGQMEARIRQLTAMLDEVVILDGPADVEVVGPLNQVEVRFVGEKSTERYLLASTEEPSDIEIISPTSPLGAAILGRSKGETVEFETPTGATIKVEIVDIA